MVIITELSGLVELSLVRIHKILLLAILLLSSIASAEISLGTVQADKSASVYPGESAQFKILLFTIQPPVHVSFAYELPDKWNILIDPGEVDLPPESGEYIALPEGYIMASRVDIKLDIPANEKPGEYEVKVVAQASSGSSGTITTTQERVFPFKITVIGESENIEKKESPVEALSNITEEEIEETTNDIGNLTKEKQEAGNQSGPSGITGLVTGGTSLVWVFVFIIITILAVAYLRH
jgi:hypothetical protein